MTMDVRSEPLELLFGETPELGARELFLVLYPKEMEDEIVTTLEELGVPGYTQFPKMVGRGRTTKHFDNSIWPGSTGAIFTVITPELAPSLSQTFRELNERLDRRSHGLYGLHMFAWPLRQII
ncbi:MAG: hypothetical protein JO023_15160 [Chloroflexi bacterium]|nr:hypothetical protein [Chloroflexota bacterium]